MILLKGPKTLIYLYQIYPTLSMEFFKPYPLFFVLQSLIF